MRELRGFFRAIVILLTVLGLGLSVMYLWRVAVGQWVLFDRSFFYGLYAIFVAMAYLLYPFRKSQAKDKVPWYDVLLALASLGIFGFFSARGYDIASQGWAYFAPAYATGLALAALILLIEASRRTAGLLFTIIVVLFFFFPMYTQFLPSLLSGVSFDFWSNVRVHALGSDSVAGIPVRVVGEILLGYLIFGVVMVKTGAGQFFLDLAQGILGWMRGGPAKVSVVSSGLFGSLSGSVLANIITTGSVTIPAMKRTGFSANTAGAVESCASTGAVLMPPVMGAVAFVMAAFMGLPYYQIALAAFVPSLIYYFGLFWGVDCIAAKSGLKGLPREECPSVRATLKGGWIYISAFVMLLYMLFYLHWIAWAPFYASGLLVVLAMLRKSTRFSLGGFVEMVKSIGATICALVPAMGAVGIIIGAFTMTGVGHAFSREILSLAGGNVYLLLVLGAVTSFILGMGMTVTACYVFLAITLAPALSHSGFDEMGIHLFLLYYAMLSYITPPVAFGAYTAATVAEGEFMKTGVQCLKLGLILFILPFGFVLSPALLLHAPAATIVFHVIGALVGAWVLACALAGYITLVGYIGWLRRIPFAAAGILLLIPGLNVAWLGWIIAAAVIAVSMVLRRRPQLAVE